MITSLPETDQSTDLQKSLVIAIVFFIFCIAGIVSYWRKSKRERRVTKKIQKDC